MTNKNLCQYTSIALASLLTASLAAPAYAQTLTPRTSLTVGTGRKFVEPADFDNDGDVDFATGGSNVGIFWSNGDLTTTFASIPITIQPNADGGIDAGDVDLDGDQDIVVANGVGSPPQGAPAILLHRNQGSQTFTQEFKTTFPDWAPADPNLGDINGNGDLDLFFQFQAAGKIEGWTNDGTGVFTPSVSYLKAGTSIQDMTLADIDNDGDLDLATGEFFGGNPASIRIRRNNGNGTFGDAQVVPAGGAEANGVHFADTDADGDLDLVVARPDLDDVGLFANDGTGNFTAPLSILSATNPWESISADLDNDGNLDLAVTSDSGPGSLKVLLGQGGGTFGAPESYGVETLPFHLGSLDLDLDGDQEVVVANLTSFSVFQNLTDPLLAGDTLTLSLAAGGTHELDLRAGVTHALEFYVVLGSISGTTPGFSGLPLNFDSYFQFCLLNPNALIMNQVGFLDLAGEGTATLTLPPGLDPGLVGVRFDHAFAALETVFFTATEISNPVGLTLVP